MAHIMLMPKLGLTMVEGKIGKWFMQEGDTVSTEEPMLQIETDKIVNKVNADENGTLLKILVQKGDMQTCKEPLCIIGEPGEDISGLLETGAESEGETEVEAKEEIVMSESNAHVMLMPKLGLTMVEGKIGKWFMQEGDTVSTEEPLLQIETDKIVNKVNATENGTLLKILVQQGDMQTCKEPLCIIGEPGDDISGLLAAGGAVAEEKPADKAVKKAVKVVKGAAGKVLASPLAKKLAKEKGFELSNISGTGPNGRIVEKDVLNHKEGPKASGAAKSIAGKLGIDLSKLNKAGRIMKADVQRAADKQKSAGGFEAIDELVEMSPMRKVIAERMTESWLTSPAVTYDLKVDATQLKVFKKQIAQSTKVTFTDLIVKVVSQVLLEVPLLNSRIVEDSLLMRNYVNMGVAVALDEGLIVPVVKNAHLMGLKELSQEIRTLAMKAKNNELEAEELQGGTFTISNLGMYEMDSFSPVINQPEVAILGITAIKDTVVVIDGEMAIRPMMNLCLSADHRAVDGSVAAQFMARVKSMIENPAQLLL